MQKGEFVEQKGAKQIPTPKLPSFFNGQKVRKLERLDDDLFRKLINSILTSSALFLEQSDNNAALKSSVTAMLHFPRDRGGLQDFQELVFLDPTSALKVSLVH